MDSVLTQGACCMLPKESSIAERKKKGQTKLLTIRKVFRVVSPPVADLAIPTKSVPKEVAVLISPEDS